MKKTPDNQRRFARFRLSAGMALLLFALAAALALAALIQSGGGNAQAQQPLETRTPTPTPAPISTPATAPETAPDFPANFPREFPLSERKSRQIGNLDSMLSQLVSRVEQGISTANSAAASAPISRGDSVAVTFYTQADAASLADFLRANGGDPRNIGAGYVEAYAPISLLARASEQPGVVRVDAIMPPMPVDDALLTIEGERPPNDRGNVTSQGVALHGADAWHDAGFTGAGVRVGVIDAGFAGVSALMGSELPANIIARCYTEIGASTSNLADCEAGQSNHGVSVAETLLDIAPGVDLFISNPQSWGDLKTAVDWMVSEEVDVINHSISWLWSGPPDGTSPNANSPLRSVDAAVSGGAAWTGSAGNEALSTWLGAFENPDSDKWLDFTGGAAGNPASRDANELNPVSLDAGETLTVALRWQGPWANAPTDLDLYLFDGAGAAVTGGTAFQDGAPGHRSFEWFRHAPSAGGEYYLAVELFGGTAPEWVQLMAFTSQELGYYTAGGSVTSPAESPNAGLLAAGAAHWWDVNTLASYSGRGPTPDGRTKPDIVGVHCAATASNERVTLANGFSAWFCGTSQSSPHIAGLAALVKQGFPDYAPHQIADYLKTNAQPRGAANPNNDWGYGFARLPAPSGPPPPTPTPTATPTSVATSTATPASGAVESRLGELERQMSAVQRLMESMQSLIQALTARVSALEQGGSGGPVATPTATPTPTPSPTPTSVSDPDPVPTTIADACIQPIQPGAISGAWTPACLSANPPGSQTYYAKFYTFTLDARADVTITLSAADSTYIYLLAGAGMDGAIEAEAGGDNTPTTTLIRTLEAGSYTIEATTYAYEVAGDFTLELAVAR